MTDDARFEYGDGDDHPEASDSNGDGIRAEESADAGSDDPRSEATDAASRAADDPDVLRARVDVLAAENERLRREYARARRSQYRRAATAMALLGALALGGAVLFADAREVLLALGGTGLFAAALTRYLAPERFVPATVGERVHEAHAAGQEALLAELGLQDDRIYVPTPAGTEPARLFVPQRPAYELPEPDELTHLLVVTDDPASRGVAFVPAGARLYEEFTATVTGEPATEPAVLAAQLADAIVETFELAVAIGTEPDLAADRLVVTVTDPVYGDLTAPDHPIVSIIGTGLATALDTPIAATVRDVDGDDARIVYEWGGGEDGTRRDGESRSG